MDVTAHANKSAPVYGPGEEGGAFKILRLRAYDFAEKISDKKLREMFLKCFFNTLDTTLQQDDGEAYVITGDIDAMWLRDSSTQVMQYLLFGGECEQTRRLIKSLNRRQMYYITQDPYANAFNKTGNGNGWHSDECEMSPIVFEKKFELDSLCYPIWLAVRYYKLTGDCEIFKGDFIKAVDTVLNVFCTEQHHEKSPYSHYRPSETPEFSVPNRGRGDKAEYTGLVWSGYRPSDDPQIYSYFLPGNMFVSVVLGLLPQIKSAAGLKAETLNRAAKLKEEVDGAIRLFGIVEHSVYGKIYAYETDGRGKTLLMDDANVPSLLSLPYLGFCDAEDEIYRNTRNFILSEHNPYNFSGSAVSGIGSPHTPKGYVWPIAVIMEGLTSQDSEYISGVVRRIMDIDAGTGFVHEGVDCENADKFTRPWFAWANSLFSYFLISKSDNIDLIKK